MLSVRCDYLNSILFVGVIVDKPMLVFTKPVGHSQ